MIPALIALLGFQLAGELIGRLTGMPVPVPVLGLVLLAAFFALRGGVQEELRKAASVILQHLPLLFITAGVGLMLHAARIEAEWLAIGADLPGRTVLSLVGIVLVFRAFARSDDREERGDP